MRQRFISFLMIAVFLVSLLSISPTVRAQESPLFSLDKDSIRVSGGEQFGLTVKGYNIKNIYACEVAVSFDTGKLAFVSGTTGIESYKFARQIGNRVYYVYTILREEPLTVNGNIDLCTLTFRSLQDMEQSSEILLESVVIVEKNHGVFNSNTYSIGKSLTVDIKPTPTPIPTAPPEAEPTMLPEPESNISKELDKLEDLVRGGITENNFKGIVDLLSEINKKVPDTEDSVMALNISDVKNIVKRLIQALRSVEELPLKNKIISELAKTISNAALAAKEIKDGQSAASVVNDISMMISDTASVLDKSNADQTKEAMNAISNAVAAAAQVIKNVDTKERLIELSEKMIAAVATVVEKTIPVRETKKLIDETVKAMENVIGKAGNTVITSTVIGKTSISKINDFMVEELLLKAETAAKAAEDIKTKMKERGFGSELEKKVTLSIDTSDDIDEISLSLPVAVLSGVKEKGVDKIELVSNLVSIKIGPDLISSLGEIKEITLTARKVELDEKTRAALSDEQRSLVESGAVVYEFNLSVKDLSGASMKAGRFDHNITVSVPYTPKEGEDPEKITVMYLDDDGQVKNMAGNYDPVTGLVTFITRHFSKYIVKVNIITFDDVPGDHWAKYYIEVMASKGIINGISTERKLFAPSRNVTRAEYIKMIVLARGLLDENAKFSYTDVPDEKWYAPYIASAYQAGIIKDSEDGKFRPEEDITREEMAVLISKTLNLQKPEDPGEVIDSIDEGLMSKDALGDIAAVVQAGIMEGKPGRVFDPKGYAKRAEAAKTIYLLYN